MEEIKIGAQVWMKENLGVDYFRNGDPIPRVDSIEEWIKSSEMGQPAWCYYNNDSTKGEKYNKLYNWYAVNDKRGLAPEGWHVPTDLEWKVLSNNLGGEDFAAKRLIRLSGSKEMDLFGGVRYVNNPYVDEDFQEEGMTVDFWTSTEIDQNNAYTRFMMISITGRADSIRKGNLNKGCGLYVRCVKD